jgi:hypothetical protein
MKKRQGRPKRRVMSRPPKKIKLLRDPYAPGQNADGTFNIGTPEEMYPRALLWKRQQEALERGEDPTLITLKVIRDEVATNPATKLAAEAWVKKVTGNVGSASVASPGNVTEAGKASRKKRKR